MSSESVPQRFVAVLTQICDLLWRFYEEKWGLKSLHLSTGVQGEVLESLQASRCIVHNIFL